MTNLVEIRKQIKKRKPTYKRVQTNQFPKFKNDLKWRRPKGMGNKDRKNRKGHVGTLKVGYGSPKELRGTNRQGFQEIVVNNLADLKAVDTKTQIPVIGKTVGGKKKLSILEEAKKNSVKISNVADVSKAIENLKQKGSTKKTKTSSKTSQKKESKSEKGESDKSKESGDSESKHKSESQSQSQKATPSSKPQSESESQAGGNKK